METNERKPTVPLLFKILADGLSCHGGSLAWSLPTKDAAGQWTPGNWHEAPGDLVPCSNGLHVTELPAVWWVEKATAYVVEVEGELIADDINHKTCCRKVRLIREATEAELAERNVFFAGRGEVKAGQVGVALGNSTVTARGNSTVTAWGNSTVTAWDNSTVTAWGNSAVTAWDNSTVTAWGNSAVNKRYASKTPTIEGYAVLIDRDFSPPKIVCAWNSTAP